jgi:ABC-type nitrate/sulfonate/bicarbonate transport system substrate-binding protein
MAATIAQVNPGAADDLVKMTIGQRGNWDTSITHLGEKAGIFKKHGLQLEMIYTSGSGETLQPVIAGGVDLGLAVGAAYAKGAPVRIMVLRQPGPPTTGTPKIPASRRSRTPTATPLPFRPMAPPPTASSEPSSMSSS